MKDKVMKLILFFPALASLSISLMGFLTATALAVTAYDIVCEFKYQIGDQPWVWG
jgi:hypothetical protein